MRKTKRQGSSTGAANKQASSPTPLPPPRTRNFCAIAHEHDGVSGPAQCGHDATRGEAKASSAGWNTHCHTHTQSHTPRVRTPPRPRTIGNARSRSRSRKGGESARPILSPAGTPLRALTLLSEERSDGALSAYAPRSHARGRARTYCTVVGKGERSVTYWLGWGPGSLTIHHRPLPLGTFTPGPPPAGIFIARTNFSPTRNPPRVRTTCAQDETSG